MRFSAAAVFSTLVAFAAAYTQPNYSNPPTGNAIIAPGLNQQVPEGTPFTIKWEPTLGKRVSLVLLRGPSSNVVPLETIVENIPNSGSYKWTPGTNLTPDTTHYGMLIVVEGTGAYQWSSQFGIAKPAAAAAATTSSAAAGTVTVIDDVTTTICPVAESSSDVAAAASSTSAPANVPAVTSAASFSTVYGTYEMTTTICPETESTAAPTVSTRVPVPVMSSVPSVPKAPSTLRSTPLATMAPTGTATAAPSSSPVYNGAGRNAISLGAVAAGVFAVLAF